MDAMKTIIIMNEIETLKEYLDFKPVENNNICKKCGIGKLVYRLRAGVRSLDEGDVSILICTNCTK